MTHIMIYVGNDNPAMFLVETPRTIVALAALKPDARVALRQQCFFGGTQHKGGDARAVIGGQHKYLCDAVALPARETDDTAIVDGDAVFLQRSGHSLDKECHWPPRRNLGIEMGMARMPCIVPNESERRNVSGARMSHRDVWPRIAQSPRTAFAMMFRCTSFEPA